MYILLDIGGTHMRIASSKGKSLDRIIDLPTPANFKSAIKSLTTAINSLAESKIKKVVVGLPRFNRGSLLYWHTNPTQKVLQKICKAPVTLTNDAQLAALGEATYGSGKNARIIGYLTLSTGLGGARIVNKNFDANSLGYEPRMQVVNYDPTSNNYESPDLYVSGRGILARYHQRPEHIKNKKVWKEVNEWLKAVINNAAVFWSPDLIIIGGAIGMNHNIKIAEQQAFLNKRFAQMPKKPKIVKAKLGQLSGLMGALALAKTK